MKRQKIFLYESDNYAYISTSIEEAEAFKLTLPIKEQEKFKIKNPHPGKQILVEIAYSRGFRFLNAEKVLEEKEYQDIKNLYRKKEDPVWLPNSFVELSKRFPFIYEAAIENFWEDVMYFHEEYDLFYKEMYQGAIERHFTSLRKWPSKNTETEEREFAYKILSELINLLPDLQRGTTQMKVHLKKYYVGNPDILKKWMDTYDKFMEVTNKRLELGLSDIFPPYFKLE